MRARTRPTVIRAAALALVATVSLAVSGDAAQLRPLRGNINIVAPIPPTPENYNGRFAFCRVAFRGNRMGAGGGWSVDFPRADVNLSIRLSELTLTTVSLDAKREPRHFVAQLTDDGLFQCPFVMMTEPGGLFLEDDEAARLRDYLLKGGFLWADDFWGDYAWQIFESQLRKALPAADFALIDLPLDHPLFRTHFQIDRIRQIPSINFWAGTGGSTSEGGRNTAQPHARAIVDKDGRILVLATHNTDYGDSWEREADDPEYFLEFAVDGYALGVNAVLYAMSH